MDHTKCPGAKHMRQPKPELFTCPKCGNEVEIWSDEFKGKCTKCGHPVLREGTMNCLDWCKMARECVGDEIYHKHAAAQQASVRESLLKEVENFFGDDKKRIDHAKSVLEHAQAILEEEKGDWHIVVPAAILHDVGIKVAEEKYASSAGPLQEKEGPPIARKLLLRAGLAQKDIDEICGIIGHHHSPGSNESLNFKILYDADCLVNLAPALRDGSQNRRTKLIESVFLTKTGKRLASAFFGPVPKGISST